MASAAMVTGGRQDWAMAGEVQQRFMLHSGATVEGLDFSGRCRQLEELGGDFFDFAPLADSRLRLGVGDASGKGVAAALMISNVQSSLRTAAFFNENDGPALLETVNRQVYATSSLERYATLFYAVVDEPRGMMRYVNAGHNPPIVLHRDGSVEWLEEGGAPVGMFPAGRYQEGVVKLKPGDLVIAYTDGVVEAENPRGEMWGSEGLRKAAEENRNRGASEIVGAVFQAMDRFSAKRQRDDATVAVLRVR